MCISCGFEKPLSSLLFKDHWDNLNMKKISRSEVQAVQYMRQAILLFTITFSAFHHYFHCKKCLIATGEAPYLHITDVRYVAYDTAHSRVFRLSKIANNNVCTQVFQSCSDRLADSTRSWRYTDSEKINENELNIQKQ